MDLQLAGKRAVVTGASRGIGLAVARALAAEGADVVLAARGKEMLDAAAEQIAARGGGRALAVVTDTTDEASVRELIRTTADAFGGVDILVNSAATPATSGFSAALADIQDDTLRYEVETKVLGYLRCARAVAPLMTAQGWGRIINVSGLAARQTGTLVGSVRNVAVAAMTKNLADELGPRGVNANVVHPGPTITEASPATFAALAEAAGVEEAEIVRRFASTVSIGRLVTAAEIADTVAFLASPLSVAINGEAIAVGGGTPGPIHY